VNTFGGSRSLDSMIDYVEHTTHKFLDEPDTEDDTELVINFSPF